MRFFKVKYSIIVSCIVGFVLSGILAFAAPPDNFTATIVSQGMEMPMAKMGNKSRVENPAIKGVVTIVIADAKKTIMMNTNAKVYSEQVTQEQDQMTNMYDPDVVFEKKKVGNETIDGHPCVKYDTVYYRKSKPNEKHKAIIWEAQDLKEFPIQMEVTVPANPKYPGSGGKMIVKYKDVKLGAATASMFEVPPGYKKVNSVQEVMGFGGMGNIEEMMKKIPKGQRPPKQ
ncbi:MAG: DUF4412 domain-containing protein [Syntrophorhabdus sp.]|jgi:hypothetical protein|nr:DUF4412 domain-containing protein [Syntrophorhabdus sp.]MDI9558119.1 DUF4412 domain-containing protein [Pseudomonadota bacterium]OQB77886.1 MAG: hypothetical protein BWX92_00527 [Deltaproteobacteria bacterium ADurb.Bin135]MBP8745524.1 DUF4412 domain-containing protein [Syntrophorhabdus sp.]NMC93633.1 DUF4412 domain-containing protein [Syntrophorhabdus sp.]